ncbi:unnamed protein product [Ophioblennius macclurei]
METSRPSALIGMLLIAPCILTPSVSSRLQTVVSHSPSAGQGGERPHVVKRSIQGCSISFKNYCMNDGKCMYLVDINEHHCQCEKGYYGPRCAAQELLVQPMAGEQVIVIIFGVGLLIIGLSGLLYFCCKWHKKNRCPSQPKRNGYKGVQNA